MEEPPAGERAMEPPVASAAQLGADLAALVAIEEQFGDVDVALRRLDDGTYWTCESCGGAIEEVVLSEAPLGRRCGPCLAAAGGDPCLDAGAGRTSAPERERV